MIKIFEVYIISVMSICFPTIIYLIFFAFKERFKKGESECLLEITLISILFLLIYFYISFNYKLYLSTIAVPILISFIFKKTKTSILLSIIIILFLGTTVGINLIIIFLLFASYYILYYIYLNSSRTSLYLTISFSLVTTFFIALYYILFNKINLNLLFIILIYNSCIFSSEYIIYKVNKAINVYTTLKEIEEDKILKTTIFKVTHEIKNPLAVIKGYLSIFDHNDIKKSQKYINIIKTEIDNALKVLKDFSEINHLKITKEKMVFNKLLKELKDTFIPFFSDKKINYSFKCEENIIINADYGRLKQVFVNLIKNSIEALDENEKIILSCYTANKNLIVVLKDFGCGMDKDTLENIFVPFYSRKSFGSGLGLCLSKEIIESHGGSINYYSSLKNFTIVKVILPI